jgi:hypothetical protein
MRHRIRVDNTAQGEKKQRKKGLWRVKGGEWERKWESEEMVLGKCGKEEERKRSMRVRLGHRGPKDDGC